MSAVYWLRINGIPLKTLLEGEVRWRYWIKENPFPFTKLTEICSHFSTKTNVCVLVSVTDTKISYLGDSQERGGGGWIYEYPWSMNIRDLWISVIYEFPWFMNIRDLWISVIYEYSWSMNNPWSMNNEH